jgi:hypothetical protein
MKPPACRLFLGKRDVGDSETGHIKGERIDRIVAKMQGIKLTKLNERERQKIGGRKVKRENEKRRINKKCVVSRSSGKLEGWWHYTKAEKWSLSSSRVIETKREGGKERRRGRVLEN